MKRPKVLLGLLVTLALAIPVIMAVPVMAQPPLNGNVQTDFTGPGVLIIDDPLDIAMPGTPPGVSGWDMDDLRLFYHAATDTMYVGINTFTILGDADGDGNPSVASPYLGYPSPPGLGGADHPNLSLTETAAVYFDLNQDGTWDVIAGISAATDYYGFSVNVFTYRSDPPYFSPPRNFGTALPGHTGNISANPDALHPDLEFTIRNWSTLSGDLGLTDTSAGFKVGAHLGSEDDDGIGEDRLEGSFSPSIDVEKLVSKDNVNFFDADNAASALDVNAGDSVYFKYVVTNTGNVTLTNITLSDNMHNVSGIAKTDPLVPLASFTGTIGPITALLGLQTDVATATGGWGGFTLQDANQANYFGSGPLIDVEKLVSKDNVNFFDADNAAEALDVNAGNSVYFKYIVTNTGNVTLSNIILSDSVHNVTGITKTDPLAPLASFNGTIGPIAALSGLQTDVATATGDWGGSTVQDTDSANYFGSGPSIDVEKLVSKDNVNFFDADNAAEALHVKTGDSIYFKYIVTNTGNVALTNITLSDNMHSVSGITKTDPLVPLASFQGVIGPITALSGLRTDVANATGAWGGITAQDSDSANYLGGAPLIDVEKLVSKDNVNFFDADNATSALYANAGGSVYFKYVVTNTGNVTLTNITLSDNMHNVSGITKTDPLAPLASFQGVIGPITTLSGLQTDVATAAGSWGGYPVQDTDPANYLGFVACIHIEKSTNGDDADSPTGPYIPIGGVVTWTYNVTNCGSVNLTNIVVTDDNGTPGNTGDDWHPVLVSGDNGHDGVLEPYSQTHEAWIYQASGNAIAGYYANIAYVTGRTQEGDVADPDDDPAHYYSRLPVGWETYPVSKLRVLLPWIGLLTAIIAGASLLALRRRRLRQKS